MISEFLVMKTLEFCSCIRPRGPLPCFFWRGFQFCCDLLIAYHLLFWWITDSEAQWSWFWFCSICAARRGSIHWYVLWKRYVPRL